MGYHSKDDECESNQTNREKDGIHFLIKILKYICVLMHNIKGTVNVISSDASMQRW